MMTKLLSLYLLFMAFVSFAQDDASIENTFNDVVGINFPTSEVARKGDLGFYIVHRFGSIENGYSDFFGLDNNASWRLGFDFGLTEKFTIGIGRNSTQKLHDLIFKGKILQQNNLNIPVSLTTQVRLGMTGEKFTGVEKEIYNFEHRLNHAITVMVARKFNDQVSAQLSVISVHENLTQSESQSNFSHAVGGTLKYSPAHWFSVVGEYVHNLSYKEAIGEIYLGNMALGFDFSTYNHNFSILITNTPHTNEIQATNYNGGRPKNSQLHLGFNISRNFRL